MTFRTFPKPSPTPGETPKPIARRTPLPRATKPIQRTGPPRKVSAKRRKQLAAYKDTRQIVLERDGECVILKLLPNICRQLGWSPGPLDVHHVFGRNDERLNDEWSCVALHRACHELVHSNQKTWRPKLLEYLRSLRG